MPGKEAGRITVQRRAAQPETQSQQRRAQQNRWERQGRHHPGARRQHQLRQAVARRRQIAEDRVAHGWAVQDHHRALAVLRKAAVAQRQFGGKGAADGVVEFSTREEGENSEITAEEAIIKVQDIVDEYNAARFSEGMKTRIAEELDEELN